MPQQTSVPTVDYQKLSLKFTPQNNLLLLDILTQKLSCYQQHNLDPNSYYLCFDKIQQQTINNIHQMKQHYKQVQKEHQMCRQECIGRNQREECLKECKKEAILLMADRINLYYRERIAHRKQYRP